MDLPCVPWQEYLAHKWSRLDQDVKDRFKSLREVDDAFTCVWKLTTVQDVEEMDRAGVQLCADKNEEEATRCRERGNWSFKSRKFTAAALHYSQGICLAPRTSEQLSLCYANRSAALYRLDLHQESLMDVDRALQNSYPDHLRHKLEERRSSCVKHLSAVTHRSAVNHLIPTSEQPEEPLCGISPRAEVVFSTEKGRHLVATDGIAAGEVILHEEPYSLVLVPSPDPGPEFGSEHRRCHRCLTETWSPVPCEGCSYSRYCSRRCLEDAWREHHARECPLTPRLRAAGVLTHLALRVALKSRLETREASTTSPELYHEQPHVNVFHLLHHLRSLSASMRFLCAATAATLVDAATTRASAGASGANGESDGGIETRSLGGAVLRHLLQLRCNAQAVVMTQDQGEVQSSVRSSQEIRVATAMFSSLSLLNHSCRPNTSLGFRTTGSTEPGGERGVAVTIRASRDIRAGQEILHCYGPRSARMATRERRRLLQEQYFFLCRCESCVQEEEEEEEEEEEDGSEERRSRSDRPGNTSGLQCSECQSAVEKRSDGEDYSCTSISCARVYSASELSLRLQEIQRNLEKAVDLLESDRPDEALSLLSRTSGESEPTLAKTHPLYGELADATARAHATRGEWKEAASHLQRSTAAIGCQYGRESVEMSRQLYKLAQLHFNGGATEAALGVIMKAKHLLSRHCGSGCPEVTELQAMEECLRQ